MSNSYTVLNNKITKQAQNIKKAVQITTNTDQSGFFALGRFASGYRSNGGVE